MIRPKQWIGWLAAIQAWTDSRKFMAFRSIDVFPAQKLQRFGGYCLISNRSASSEPSQNRPTPLAKDMIRLWITAGFRALNESRDNIIDDTTRAQVTHQTGAMSLPTHTQLSASTSSANIRIPVTQPFVALFP
jgi:hypothetical protein